MNFFFSVFFSSGRNSGGEMFTWGINNCGQFGDGTESEGDSPTEIKFPLEIAEDPLVSVSCGSTHDAFVTARGFFCSWGGNGYGQLGNGSVQEVLRPEVINLESLFNRTEENKKTNCQPETEKIIQVECGDCFTVIRSNKDRLFSCGLNRSGQLGIDSTNHQSSFKEVRFPSDVLVTGEIKQMVLGYRHVIVLLAGGKCYVWGETLCGQLGLGKRKDNVSTPTLASFDFRDETEDEPTKEENSSPRSKSIVQVAASGCASFFLLDSGEVYSCGINDVVGQGSGQLWKGRETHFYSPTKMEGISSRVDTLFVESGSRSFFAVNLSEKIVFAWGPILLAHQSGILDSRPTDPLLPSRAFSSLLSSSAETRILTISAGSSFSAILLKEKEEYSLFTCGQVASKEYRTPTKVILPTPLFTNDEEREWTLRSGDQFVVLALVRKNAPRNPSLKLLVYRFYKFHYET